MLPFPHSLPPLYQGSSNKNGLQIKELQDKLPEEEDVEGQNVQHEKQNDYPRKF